MDGPVQIEVLVLRQRLGRRSRGSGYVRAGAKRITVDLRGAKTK